MSKNEPLAPLGKTISLKDAEHLTKEWRHFIHRTLHIRLEDCLKAFYIPISDIENLAKTHGAEAVRAYLCLEHHNHPNEMPSTIKVAIVPVVNGQDVLFIKSDLGVIESSSIYDLTQPCPAQCDKNSPLY